MRHKARHVYWLNPEPRAYWDTIRAHGEQLGLDPYLVAALIRQESLFGARAVSPKGARGLMQLMPTTAARLAGKAGQPAPSAQDLERPEVNITYGTAYLKELHDRYGGAVFKVLAADADNEYAMIDSTIVRAHQHSAGARKKTAATRRSGAVEED